MQSETAPDGAVDTTKAAFRKPSNEAVNRKYRRRSPLNGSSSDGSPKHDRSSSPIYSRGNSGKDYEYQKRRKEVDRDSGRSQYSNSRGGDSYRHSDRQSSRGSHGYLKHDESVRHEKHANEGDRYNQKSSSRSGRDSRGSANYEYTRPGSDYSRSKDYVSGSDRSIRDKYDVLAVRSKDSESSYMDRQKYKDKDPSADRDGSGRRHTYLNSEEIDKDWHKQDRDGRDEKRDYRRSSEDYRSDRTHIYEESRGHQIDSSSRRDGHRLKEANKNDAKEVDGQRSAKEERKKYDQDTNRDKDKYHRASGEHLKDKVDVTCETQEAPAKKSRVSNWDKGAEYAKDVDKLSSSSNQIQEAGANVIYANDSETTDDLNAAKVAAMKAAELVNKNLVGVGYMSTDQKKKLLWGNKKSTATEESGRRWESTQFDDRDRQEKFNKLMGVKGELKLENKPSNVNGEAEKQSQLQLDLEKQYTAGLRRRDGRTVGLGL